MIGPIPHPRKRGDMETLRMFWEVVDANWSHEEKWQLIEAAHRGMDLED